MSESVIKPGPRTHAFPRTDRSPLGVWWWTTDHWLLGATAALIGLGVLLQFGTSPAAAQRLDIAWPFHFAARQCVFAAGATVILLAVSMSPLSSNGALPFRCLAKSSAASPIR